VRGEFGEEVTHRTTDASEAAEFHEIVDLRRHLRRTVE
jgi:hypothetical protein